MGQIIMENDIGSWLEFAKSVESGLNSVERDFFAKSYVAKISDLLDQIKSDSKLILELSIIEKQEAYIRINKCGTELRELAYFVDRQLT